MASQRTLIVAVALAAAVAGPARAQNANGVRTSEVAEIAPFRLTGMEGYVEGSRWTDSDHLSTSAGGGANARLSNTVGKVFVMTHGYVFHPNLLLLDLGAGGVLFRNRYVSDGAAGDSGQSTYELDTRATFLQDKPYRGGLHYRRLNDRQALGPTQSMLTRNTRYGMDLSLLAPVTPVPMHLNAFRAESRGSSPEQVIDDRLDEVDFRAERAWGRLGHSSLHLQSTRTDSRSGSLGLPIQGTVSLSRRADLDTRVTFGEGRRDSLTQALSFHAIRFSNRLATIADDTLLRFDLHFRAQPDDDLESWVRYLLEATDRRAQSGAAAASRSRLSGVALGGSWRASPELSLTGDGLISSNNASALQSSTSNLGLAANYRAPLGGGELALTGSVTGAWRDQAATSPTTEVVGERRTLAGLAWVALRQFQVQAGSVVVQNASRTQTYTEGLDYSLRVIGFATEIQRLAAGAILDGQELLIDYAYDTGGTFAMREWGKSFDVAWRMLKGFSVFGRYVGRSSSLVSGVPTAPLNPGHEVTLGAQADLPYELWGEQMTAGALAEWARRSEAVSPSRRTLYEVYVESSVPFIARGGLRLGARQQHTAYGLTPLQDVTQRTLTLRLWSRFRSGLTVHADAMASREAGALAMGREYQQASLNAQWRIRQLLMSLRFDGTRQLQAGAERNNARAHFELRRDF